MEMRLSAAHSGSTPSTWAEAPRQAFPLPLPCPHLFKKQMQEHEPKKLQWENVVSVSEFYDCLILWDYWANNLLYNWFPGRQKAKSTERFLYGRLWIKRSAIVILGSTRNFPFLDRFAMKSIWWFFPVYTTPPQPTHLPMLLLLLLLLLLLTHTHLSRERVAALKTGLAWVSEYSKQWGQSLQFADAWMLLGGFLKTCCSFQHHLHLVFRTEL